MKPLNIWLVSLFDPTPMDNTALGRVIGIAEAAVGKGHKVLHFTSTFRHTSKKHRYTQNESKKINDNYSIRYVNSMGYQKNMYPKRFYAHYDFSKKLIKDFKNFEKPDLVFLSMPPLSVGFEISKWSMKNQIPYVVDIIDPWPDSFIKDVPQQLKRLSKFMIFPFAFKLRQILNNANALTAISRGYIEWALSYIKREDLPSQFFYPAVNFSDTQTEINKNAGFKKGKKIRLIYAGSLASSYDIPCILDAAEKVEKVFPGQTEFIIAGVGHQEEEVRKYEVILPNLKYLGWLNKEELYKQYYLADLGFIQHKNSLTQTVTYKLFSYLSAGLPVLNSLQSEMVEMIDSNNVGMNNKEGDSDKLAANIIKYLENPGLLKEHQQNALNFTAEYGDSRQVYPRLVAFLEEYCQQLYEPQVNG